MCMDWPLRCSLLACSIAALCIGPMQAQEPRRVKRSVVSKLDSVSRERFTESDRDALGYFRNSRSFPRCLASGAKVIDFPGEASFAVLWKPPNYHSGRVMVLLHDAESNAYDELGSELAYAREHDYFLISLQWYDHHSQAYLSPTTAWRLLERTLHFVAARHDVDPNRAALSGFSRGAMMAYELAWRDAEMHHHFKLVICHSGAVFSDINQLPPSMREFETFFERFNRNEYTYRGTKFFLYSGDRDEYFGSLLSDHMQHTRQHLSEMGGHVVTWVREHDGGHRGYYRRTIHEQAVHEFIKQTPEQPK